MLDPITFPKAISGKPSMAAFTLTIISGAEVAKETTVRTWFNEESGNKIELKNPIKTYDRIKGQTQKYNFYKLIKERSI